MNIKTTGDIKLPKSVSALTKFVKNVLIENTGNLNDKVTRRSIIDRLKPTFELAKKNHSIYAYKVICNHKNNTQKIIDNGELILALLLKRKKESEFSLFEFVVKPNPKFKYIDPSH